MQELLHLEDFEQYDAPIRAVHYRNAFAAGLMLWSVIQFALTANDEHARGAAAISATAALSLLGGALFGLALVGATYLDHRRRLAQLGRVLAYDSRVVPPPPEHASHRLPCGLVIDRRTVVPGSLYVVPNGLMFRSNIFGGFFADRLLRGSRQSPLELLFAPAREVTLDARLLPRSRLQRFMSRVETPLLLVHVHGSVAAFRVACTFDSLRRLERALDVARHGAPTG